jgi:hypothetical protein
MSQSRKTVSVARVLVRANYFLEHSKPEQVAERKTTHVMTEHILMDSNNYRGFGYHGMTPKNDGSGQYNIPDESRTFFYVHENLREEYQALVKEMNDNGFLAR